MRAATHDLTVETGATLTQQFSVFRPGAAPVMVGSIAAGDRVYYKDQPTYVYSTSVYMDPLRPECSTIRLIFGSGAWYEPVVTLPIEATIFRAEPVAVTTAEAGFTVPDAETGPARVAIPATITGPNNVSVDIDAATTLTMTPLEGSWSWDLYVEADGYGWARLVEGTMTVIRGSGRAGG